MFQQKTANNALVALPHQPFTQALPNYCKLVAVSEFSKTSFKNQLLLPPLAASSCEPTVLFFYCWLNPRPDFLIWSLWC